MQTLLFREAPIYGCSVAWGHHFNLTELSKRMAKGQRFKSIEISKCGICFTYLGLLSFTLLNYTVENYHLIGYPVQIPFIIILPISPGWVSLLLSSIITWLGIMFIYNHLVGSPSHLTASYCSTRVGAASSPAVSSDTACKMLTGVSIESNQWLVSRGQDQKGCLGFPPPKKFFQWLLTPANALPFLPFQI